MNFLIHFYLAHFLSDYPFQPNRLIKLKQEGYLGVFIHALVHLASMLVILSPLLHDKRIWGSIALVYITHNIIDQIKVKLDAADPRHARFYYFLDQFLHWIIIYIAYRIAGDVQPNLTGTALEIYTNETLWLYILVMVLSTYFFDVTRYFVLLKTNKPFKRDYKTMLVNGLIVTVAFGVYWLTY
jgi:hypothetical protein